MTPANPDALADALARELARLDGWQDPDALWTDNIGIIDRGGEGSPVYLDYVEDAGKLIAGPLAPILADLQRVTAERDAAVNKANEEETSAVWDKAMRRIAENESARLRARAAQLQAEAEALKGALEHVKAWIDADLPAGTSRAGTVHRAVTNALETTKPARRVPTG